MHTIYPLYLCALFSAFIRNCSSRIRSCWYDFSVKSRKVINLSLEFAESPASLHLTESVWFIGFFQERFIIFLDLSSFDGLLILNTLLKT